MPFLKLQSTDVTLHYQVVGGLDAQRLDSAKPTLLLLHPGLTDLEYFRALCEDPDMQVHFNLVAFDTPAHGQTKGTVTPDGTLERKARCLVEAWDTLGYGAFHCLGEGLCGSTIGLYLALMRPELVQSLQLISPIFGYDNEARSRVYLQLLESLTNHGSAPPRFGKQALQTMQGLYQGQATQPEDRDGWAERLERRYGQATDDELRELFNPLINRRPISDAVLEEVKCPTIILAGSADQASSIDRAEQLAQSLSGVPDGASVHVVHNAPHFMTQAYPTIVRRFVKRFMERQ